MHGAWIAGILTPKSADRCKDKEPVDRRSSRQRYLEKRRARRSRALRSCILTALSGATLVMLGLVVLVVRPLLPHQIRMPAMPAMPNIPNLPSIPTMVAGLQQQPTPTAAPVPSPPAVAAIPTPSPTVLPQSGTVRYLDNQRLSYEPDFYQEQIQAVLDRSGGSLGAVRFQVGDRTQSLPDVLVNLSVLYSFNPKILLTALEMQSQLLSTPNPTPDQTAWALGFRGEGEKHRGLYNQIRWGAFEIRAAIRDYALSQQGAKLPDLEFDTGDRRPVPADLLLADYVVVRLLAGTTSPQQLDSRMQAFVETYGRLFEDPRTALVGLPPPAAPFFSHPLERRVRVTSFFDHDTPFLRTNGSLLAFWGNTDLYSYDGHTGWDYAALPSDVVLAVAAGKVVFAGNSDDGCGIPARAVAIDHGNGYRTLYWHLSSIAVAQGQQVAAGTPLGYAGATGCAFGSHLHLQVQYLGRDVDPYGWCGSTPDPWATNPAGQVSVWLWAGEPSPCGAPPPGFIVVDDSSPGFRASGEWTLSALGYAGNARYSRTRLADVEPAVWQVRMLSATPDIALWQPELPAAGNYRVLVYVPYILNGLDDARTIRYQIRHRDGESEALIDGESAANAWIDLGTYPFDPAMPAWVSVSTLSNDAGRGIWVDAVAWVPVADAADAPATGAAEQP